ncbi:hypothetical protein BD626DRAFT_503331 [Schizophyllum amplum]|uniref:F-box domain-containing protein n=1 Tax=Schizophyllum amplum TaxID=97359 RepID=A0A550C8C8_9AGAR|nr:hypothetical protein BD626DRAFT_503331 [Auriculariopsis ampla]
MSGVAAFSCDRPASLYTWKYEDDVLTYIADWKSPRKDTRKGRQVTMIGNILILWLRSATIPPDDIVSNLQVGNNRDRNSIMELHSAARTSSQDIRGVIERKIMGLLVRCCVRDAIVAPVRRLPSELLQAIFVAAVSEETDPELQMRTRLRIACVSYHWRAVALATGEIWTNIACSYVFPSSLRRIPILKLCVERAGSRPLRVTVIRSFEEHESPEEREELLATIAHAEYA